MWSSSGRNKPGVGAEVVLSYDIGSAAGRIGIDGLAITEGDNPTKQTIAAEIGIT